MARHSQPQKQPNWKLLVFNGKNSSVGGDCSNSAYDLCLKLTTLLCLIISCAFPGYSKAAGSFATISGYYGGIYKTGFASMEDAAAWGWANGILSYFPDRYSYAGVVYYKPLGWPNGAPPASGDTNYHWGYYYHDAPGVTRGPFPYYDIYYDSNVPPPAKNFGSPCDLSTSNPIHIGLGEKYQVEKDYLITHKEQPMLQKCLY